MKLVFENYNMRYTVESERQDFDSAELKEIFGRMLVQAGFPPSVVDFGGEDGGSYEYVAEDELVIKKEELLKHEA